MAKALKAGTAYVDVTVNSAKVKPALASLSRTFNDWSRRAADIGMKTMMTASAIAAPLGMSMKVFADFERQMGAVRAITKATGDEIKLLREQAKELGRTTFFTTSQVAEAQKFLGMAGFDPQQILGATPAVLDLALAGDMDLGTAADIATNISTPFRIAAEDLSRVNDVLATAATSSNTTIAEMGQAFKYAAPAAAAAGQSIEECAAAMAILANNGIKADTAGTSMRMMMIKLADSGIQQKLMTGLGVKVTDKSGEMRPLLSVLREMDAAMAGMSNTDKMSYMFDIFEQRAGTSALVLSRAGDAITEYRSKMDESPGSGKEMAGIRADNIYGDFKMVTSAAEGVQIAVGEAFNGMARDTLQALAPMLTGFAEWISTNQEIVQSLGMLTVGAAGVGGALLTASAGMKAAAVAVNVLSPAYQFGAKIASIYWMAQMPNPTSLSASLAGITSLRLGAMNLIATLGLSHNAMNMSAASMVLMSNAEAAASVKNAFITRMTAATTAVKSLTVANIYSAGVTKATAAAEVIHAAVTKALTATKVAGTAAIKAFTLANVGSRLASIGSAIGMGIATVAAKGLAGSYLLAAVAAKGLSVAISSIPIVGWIAAAVAGVGALAYALSQTKTHVAELSDEMEKLREKGDQTRNVDSNKMNRLKEMAELENMSDKEKKLAQDLLGELKGKYGDFGVTMDETTGKLNVAADAVDRFTEALNKQALMDLEKELQEAQNNLAEVNKKGKSLDERGVSALNTASRWIGSRVTGGGFKNKEGVYGQGMIYSADYKLAQEQKDWFEKEKKPALEKEYAIRKKIAAIKGGTDAQEVAKGDDRFSATDEGVAASLEIQKKAREEAERGAKRLMEIEERRARDRRSNLQNEIHDIEKQHAEYVKLLQEQLDFEMAKKDNDADPEKRRDWLKIEELQMKLDFNEQQLQDDIDRALGKIKPPKLDVEINLASQSVLDAQLRFDELKRAGASKDQLQTAQDAIDSAQYDLETAELAKASEEVRTASEKFKEAVEEFDRLSKGDDRAAATEAGQKVEEAKKELDTANSRYTSARGKTDLKEYSSDDEMLGQAKAAVAEAQRRLGDAMLTGNAGAIASAQKNLETTEQASTKVEYAKASQEEAKARQRWVDALNELQRARTTGATQDVLAKLGHKTATAETDYQSAQQAVAGIVSKMQSGLAQANQTANFTRQVGTHSRWDILGGAVSTGKVENQLDKIASSSKDTANHTRDIKNNLTFSE